MRLIVNGVSLLCIFYFVQDTEGQTPLAHACKHNEFRCSGGSRCLSTEKLCNGKKECPEGEDERGTAQWDCSKRTLSTECDPVTEYKCRFGGCILREKICDGKPDCWGANDEAIEVCQVRKPTPPTNSRPRPAQPEKVRPSSTPPPRRPSRPRPKPTPAAPPPSVQNQGQGPGCPPILEDQSLGFDISCANLYDKPVGCTKGPLSIGSKALYKCKKYYSPPTTGSSVTERTCQESGQWSPRRQSFTCNLGCGNGGYENVALITGGITSKKGKWPWHVALYQEDPPNSNKFEFFCGGSLISEKAVLTAAHCVAKRSSSAPRDEREILVVLGKYYRGFTKRDGTEQDRKVRQIAIHEEYNHYSLDNDIAIIWLDMAAIISDHVRPVCLPFGDDEIYPEDLGQLVGWGRSSNGRFAEELQEAKIPVINPKTCREAHPTFNSLVRTTTFCAGYRNGTSACDGDSGGGLIFPDSESGKRWQVRGIVSAGIAKNTGGCQEQYYSVFTRVGKYFKWIERKLDSNYYKK